jgi:hypothetical protein
MFTKRHEQELAEIKATTQQLSERFEGILEQLERIKQNQDQLAAATQSPGGEKRKAGRGRPGATEASGTQASSTEAADRGRSAKRRGKGRKAGSGGGRKRRRSRSGEDAASTEE